MKTSIITWADIHRHGDLWWQHLQLRRALFVNEKGWGVPHNHEAEWDQYDNANTVYVITHSEGQVLAASRLNPCNFESGGWSYMIRDACLGKLPGIPTDILNQTELFSDAWEATRFTVSQKISQDARDTALAENAKALYRAATQIKTPTLLALMRPGFIRWLTDIGLPTERLGPTRKDATGERICVMSMAIAL
ncbi:MAG: acyl-homoserine-lactone synthase [Arenibacterium sp.]